jgi:tetratricopeptide (TPR) repeat protein
MARRLLFLLWLAAALASAAHAEDPSRRLAAYLELGARYRAGDPDGAVAELLRWPTAEVDAAVRTLIERRDDLRACGDWPEAIEAATAESLVLLHLDAIRRLDPNAPPRPAALRHEADTATKILEWLRRTTEHWPTGSAASSAATGCPYRPRIARREFYFTLAGFLLGRCQPEEALRAADTGLERERDDAGLLLAAACAHEQRSQIARMSRATPGNPIGDQGPAGAESRKYDGDVRSEQELALALLRQILRNDPPAYTARLRRGRLLWLRRRHEQAEAELRLAGEAPEPETRYLAELFRGGVREERQDANGAAEAYRRATAALPKSQTARVALARLLLLAGRAEEAGAQVLGPLAGPWSTDVHDDPWWLYTFGTWPEAEKLFDVLRRRVAER